MYEKRYKELGFTETHLRVLSLFTNGFRMEYYIREVHRILGISPRTAQLVLDSLEGRGVLESELRGKIRSYRIRKSHVPGDYLAIAEHYKRLSFLEEHEKLRQFLSKTIPFMKGIVAVFGSYAKGTEKTDSDLDLFVAGECDRPGIRDASKLYGIDVNIKIYPMDAFRRGMNNDVLVREVLESHVIIRGTDEFIGAVLDG